MLPKVSSESTAIWFKLEACRRLLFSFMCYVDPLKFCSKLRRSMRPILTTPTTEMSNCSWAWLLRFPRIADAALPISPSTLNYSYAGWLMVSALSWATSGVRPHPGGRFVMIMSCVCILSIDCRGYLLPVTHQLTWILPRSCPLRRYRCYTELRGSPWRPRWTYVSPLLICHPHCSTDSSSWYGFSVLASLWV